jgi:KUP system potassium uptake protein
VGAKLNSAVILGVFSLVLCTLFVITCIKYVSVAMCIDNDGEGGILALMSLLGVNKQQRLLIIAFGLFGAALIYGDGAVTAAISVLSAVEGLHMATPVLEPYILPNATAILVRYLRSSLWGHTILVRLSVPSCSSPGHCSNTPSRRAARSTWTM